MTTPMQTQPALPYKSVAAALLFSVILGPVGLLYASFWGGLFHDSDQSFCGQQ